MNRISGEDLARCLANKYQLDRSRDGYVYVSQLSELQYVIGEDHKLHKLEDGTLLEVYDHPGDYSIIDPDSNPMSFVIAFHFNTGSRYLEIYGHYVSHDGGYWDGYHEVKPRVREVKTFE